MTSLTSHTIIDMINILSLIWTSHPTSQTSPSIQDCSIIAKKNNDSILLN